jgi:dolichyl-phosphate-mannose--protein O-mannosyl transferase
MLTIIFPAVVALIAVAFTALGFPPAPVGRLGADGLAHRPHPMEMKDFFPLAFLIVIYAGVAFAGLGVPQAPQSFHSFSSGDSVTLELDGGEQPIGEIMWYSGIGRGEYIAEISRDGENWTEQGVWQQPNSDQLRWHSVLPQLSSARFLRLTAQGGNLSLGEIVLRAPDGEPLPLYRAGDLGDEPETAPWKSDYLNGTYFDEIYHVRTAMEFLEGSTVYEISHPPLGKSIIALGISIFGATPFGWRFMGVFFGVLMLPFMYVFVKNLFGRTRVALCASTIFAFDFMHYTQTRIATIDSFSVFFILAMFYFIYRWFAMPLTAKPREYLPWFALSGLCFGLGAAVKWTVVYGGMALAIIWFLRTLLLALEAPKGSALRLFLRGVGEGLVFFVIVPAAIYLASYSVCCRAWQTRFMSGGFLKRVWENQEYMMNYHSNLRSTHPYQSRWWQWVCDMRPILFFIERISDTQRSSFASFGNPLFWWTGVLCVFTLAYTAAQKRDLIAGIIVLGWFSELAPWLAITRCAFIYHYFPCTVFLTLALAYQMNGLCERAEENAAKRAGKRLDSRSPAAPRPFPVSIYVFTALCLVMFLIFYPVLSGLPAPLKYTRTALRWFSGQYPF